MVSFFELSFADLTVLVQIYLSFLCGLAGAELNYFDVQDVISVYSY